MPFISVTRLKVKSVFLLPQFLKANSAAVKQLKVIPGFLGGKELIDKGLVFWTLTMWDDDSSMKSFRNNGAHKTNMQQLPYWCSEASYVHWVQQEAILPDWKTASEKLLLEGKLTKVRNPSANQLENKFPQIKWSRLENNIKPVSPL